MIDPEPTDPVQTDSAPTDPGPSELGPNDPEAIDLDTTDPEAIDLDAINLDAIERDLDDVETALARLAEGTYRIDEVTGETLPGALLERNPTARRA